MTLGPLIIGIEGITLTRRDCQRLMHPLVGGVILFDRNYQSREQLRRLTMAIHAIRAPELIIMVDQEGGRVQRFRDEFAAYFSLRTLGHLFDHNPQQALRVAQWMGEQLTLELLACGVDSTLAPVLDLDYQHNQVIGSRAFHIDPSVVVQLAQAFCGGMRNSGFKAIGKHCPGHGYVAGDTHTDKVIDTRCPEHMKQDWLPFMAHDVMGLSGMMLSHIIYQCVDHRPAGFSPIWHEWCREVLQFHGVLVSDDLGMVAAQRGQPEWVVKQALNAGLDLLLMCNDFDAIDAVLKRTPCLCYANKTTRIKQLRPDRIYPESRINARLKVLQRRQQLYLREVL